MFRLTEMDSAPSLIGSVDGVDYVVDLSSLRTRLLTAGDGSRTVSLRTVFADGLVLVNKLRSRAEYGAENAAQAAALNNEAADVLDDVQRRLIDKGLLPGYSRLLAGSLVRAASRFSNGEPLIAIVDDLVLSANTGESSP